METIKVYLDMCSYSRPFDDQRQMKIRMETEAKLYIQAKIREDEYCLSWFFMLDYENGKNPYEDVQSVIAPWKDIADNFCAPSEDILSKGEEIMTLGIKNNDALHIACAIKQKCDYFITTDRKLLNKAVDGIKIINPIDFIRETEDKNEN